MSSSPSGREVKSGLGITVTSLCVTHTGLYIRELIEKIRSGPRAVDPPPVVARLCNSALWVALIFGLHMPPLALRTAAPVSAGGGGFEGGEEGLLGKKREGSRRGSAHKHIHTHSFSLPAQLSFSTAKKVFLLIIGSFCSHSGGRNVDGKRTLFIKH